MNPKAFLAVFIALAFVTQCAYAATTVIIAPSSGHWMDTYIDSDNPNSNYKNANILQIDGQGPLGGKQRALFWFDVSETFSGIPAGATIQSALLHVNVQNSTYESYSVFQLTEQWSSSQATWNNRLNGVAWSSAGAMNSSHNPTPIDSFTFSSPSWQTIDVTQAVQNWVNGQSNYGLVFYNDSSTDGLDVYSSDSYNAPYAEITYSTGGGGAGATLAREPYLQQLTSNSVIVAWKTNESSTGNTVEYGTTLSYGSSAASSSHDTCYSTYGCWNSVQLTGLSSGTKYYYRISTNGTILREGANYFFETPPLNDSSYSFIVMGDIGRTGGFQSQTAAQILALSTKPGFGLFAGDLVYDNGEESNYDPNLMTPLKDIFINTPVWVVPGNHDWRDIAPYYRNWYMPGNEEYYSFDYGNAHIIALDSGGSGTISSTQKNWLISDLSSNQGKEWIFVFLHHNGNTCDDGYKSDYPDVIGLYPIFNQYNVDLVFNGHKHTYERLYPFNDSGNPVDTGMEPNYSNPAGFISVTTGAGGVLGGSSVPGWQPDPNCSIAASQYHASGHFSLITVNNNTLTLQAIASDGSGVKDSMTLSKATGPDTTPPVRSNAQPTGTLASGTTSTTISLTTNENATCKYSTSSGVSYSSMPSTFSTTGTTTHFSTVTGLTDGSTSNYYVKCQDTALNANTDDFIISFSVASAGGEIDCTPASVRCVPSEYSSISNAISAANPGDTVLVFPGTYYPSSSLYIDKAGLTLKGTDRSSVIIDGSNFNSYTGYLGDLIYVESAGNVRIEALTVRNAGRAGLRISNSDNVTVVNATFGPNAHWGVFTNFSNYTTLDNIEAFGSGGEHGVYISNSSDYATIKNSYFHDNHYSGLQINADPYAGGDKISSGNLIENNLLMNNGIGNAFELNLSSVRNSVIQNNVILALRQGAGGIAGWDEGYSTAYGTKDNVFANNTIYMSSGNHWGWALSLKNGSNGNTIVNNLFVGGSKAGYEFDNDTLTSSQSLINYNIFYNPSGTIAMNEDTGTNYSFSQWQSLGNGANSRNLTLTEFSGLFADPVNNDLHLKSGSAAIDAGTNTNAPLKDKDGNSRPVNGVYDIGAYEFGGTAGPECTSDAQCSGGQICCSQQCALPACSTNADCSDGIACTTDSCNLGGTCNASCSFNPITQCINSDGCCPSGCDNSNDNDCLAPVSGHPRIWITPEIRQRIQQKAAQQTADWVRLDEVAYDPKATNYWHADSTIARALIAQVYFGVDDAKYNQYCGDARVTAQSIIDHLNSNNFGMDATRTRIMPLAIFYDWCYDSTAMDSSFKQTLLDTIYDSTQVGWLYGYYCNDVGAGICYPFINYPLIAFGEYGLAGIAMHDDDSRLQAIYNKVFVERWPVFRDTWKWFGVGGAMGEATIYNEESLKPFLLGLEGYRTYTGTNLFDQMGSFARDHLKFQLLNFHGSVWSWGGQLGRGFFYAGDGEEDREITYAHPWTSYLVLLNYVYQKNPSDSLVGYVKAFLDAGPTISELIENEAVVWAWFLWNDSSLPSANLSSAPTELLANEAPVAGWVNMKGGFGENDTSILTISGDSFVAWHNHLDNGSFQVYKGGSTLLIDSGKYDGYGDNWYTSNYAARTIAHNSVLIYSSNEDNGCTWNLLRGEPSANMLNDGGQKGKYVCDSSGSQVSEVDTPDITGKNWGENPFDSHLDVFDRGAILSFENSPDFTFVEGDITNSYAEWKTNQVNRAWLYLRPQQQGGDDFLLVFDRVNSLNPGWEKYILFHTVNQPTGGTTSSVTDWPNNTTSYEEFTGPNAVITASKGNAKAQLRFLLPKQRRISKIGGTGKEQWVFSENVGNYEGIYGNWRIEVIPSNPSNFDNFLTVVFPSLASNSAVLDTELVESTDLYGAVIKSTGSSSNRVGLFSKTGSQVSSTQQYSVDVIGATQHVVTGLEPGLFYNVSVNGGTPQNVRASASGVIEFET